MTLVYDTLTERDARGTPQPLLARSIERRGRTVTVRLRRGPRWHDGRPLELTRCASPSADLPQAEDHAAQRRLEASGAAPARRSLRDALPELRRRLASQSDDQEGRLSEALADVRADRI